MPDVNTNQNLANGFDVFNDTEIDRSVSGVGHVSSDAIEGLIASGLPAGSTDISSAEDHVRIFGGSGRFSGIFVSRTGDVNADGVDDILIADRYAPGASNPGPVNVVFGHSNVWDAVFDLDTLDGTNGFRITSPAGFNVGNAGDVNGDGISDILTRDAVIFGSAIPFDASIDVSDLDGENGFQVIDFNTLLGGTYTVAGLGDVNGDGFDDVAFAVLGGEAHIILGSDANFPATVSAAALNGTSGFTVTGFDNGRHTPTVAAAGDLNGDGINDIIVSAQDYNLSYVVFGSLNGFDANIDVRKLDGTSGFRIDAPAGSLGGFAISGIGDVNGDGLDDLAIGAPWARPGGAYKQGQAYVVYGSDAGFASAIDIETLDGSNGFKIPGLNTGDEAGWSVSGPGDMNGDGIDDFTVGTYGNAYIIYGSAGGFGAMLDLAQLDGNGGQKIAVNDAYYAGRDIQVAGDINGDDVDDVLIPVHTLNYTLLYSGKTEGDEPDSSFAQDDALTVSTDMLGFYGSSWFRLGAVNNHTDLLENDIGAEEIVSVNAAPLAPGVWFDGDGGGQFRVYPGGVVDFRNEGTPVLDGDATGFTYTGSDGTVQDNARVSVTIDAGADIAKDDSFEVTNRALVAAGQSWFRLGALNDDTDLLENDVNVDEFIFVDGLPLQEGVWFDGSNGGQFRAFHGGVVDFRNQGNAVVEGDTTGFSYGVVQDGMMDTAVISLTVEREKIGDSLSFPLQIKGIDVRDFSGYSVASAGDVDGDGLGDVIIGAHGASSDSVYRGR